MKDDILRPIKTPDEAIFEESLRPRKLEEFIGQEKLKEKLYIFIEAARRRGEALDHVLFYGPPGLGKTTLAYIISAELDCDIVTTTGPTLERAGDLAGILTNLKERAILFIDEIHRLPRVVEEYLYPAMEDFKLDIIIERGAGAKSLRLNLNRFTLIGSTTRAGLISSPLRSRFGIIEHLDYYPPDELFKIVIRSGRILGINIDESGALEIAKRARGTPRVANRLLRRVRDFAEIKYSGKIDSSCAKEALELLEVDELGLDQMDKRLLQTIIEKFRGGPVGISTIAIALSEDEGTIEELYEPYLVQTGLLERTPRGRIVTRKAYSHLGYSTEDYPTLFK
jgi:Holliday junction DNA helicase RuvB